MKKRVKKLLKIFLMLIMVAVILEQIVPKADIKSDANYGEFIEAVDKNAPKLIIGDDIDYSPYSFLDDNGQPTGFNIEIAKAAGRAMGYNVEIRLDEWDNIRKALENDEINAISGMFFNSEREKLYSFTSKHSITNGDIFTKNNIKVKNINSLRGKTVVVQKSDIVAEYLESLNLDIDLVEVSTVQEALKLVKDGTYDYAGILKLPGLYRIKVNKWNNLKAQGIMLAPNYYCMAVKKGNEDVLLTLNGGLQIIKATGEYQQIYDKWLGVYEEKDLMTYIKKYKIIILSISLLILGLILISLILKKMVNMRTKELLRANLSYQEKNTLLMLSEAELRKQQEYINHMAFHDPLTDLPNRRKFNECLEEAIKSETGGAIVLLDLDNFKSINDTIGHIFGDKVLKSIAERLNQISNENVFVSRFGGDEFLILIKNESSHEKIKAFVENVKRIFDEKIIIEENEINVSFSMGVSIFPQDSREVDQLIKYVDLALYKVKNLGKNSYAFFDNSLMEKILRRKMIETKLNLAINEDGFEILYQPQVRLLDGEIVCYEALLRLKNCDISPVEFISIAEENGTIVKIGRIVTSMVIKQLIDWKQRGFKIKPVSINYSAAQLYDSEYISFLTDELDKYKIDPKYIEIEITENIFLNNKDQTVAFLKKLRDIGIKISIDDFGTGYSSLSYLAFLPINKIKLDKSINDKFLQIENIKVMDNLILLLQSMNLEMTAEGIETFEQVKKLKIGNCDFAQGYYFSRPLKVEDVEMNYNINYLNLL